MTDKGDRAFGRSVHTAAREVVRARGGDVVFIDGVLEALAATFEQDVHVTRDVWKVLDLIETLTAAPGVHRVDDEFISFCWIADDSNAGVGDEDQ